MPNPLVKLQERQNYYRSRPEIGCRTEPLAADWVARATEDSGVRTPGLHNPDHSLRDLMAYLIFQVLLSADELRETFKLVSNR